MEQNGLSRPVVYTTNIYRLRIHRNMSEGSHHERIYGVGGNMDIGYIRVTNDGKILSIWIDHMKTLFVPESGDGQ